MTFTIPMLPPTVNHYVKHTRNGRHYKTQLALAWEHTFATHRPKDEWVNAKQFRVSIELTFGPKDRMDVDNGNKCVLDAIASYGMLRNVSGRRVSDSYVKRLEVTILDGKKDRANGPKTVITIAALS
jgi:Holliday junction resolvase RusA-like endonuclease